MMKKKIKIIKILILVIIILLAGFTYYYSHSIAPAGYKIQESTITKDSLPAEFDNFEIGFISDINLGDSNDIDRLEKIVASLNDQNVDMVIFGGDLFQSNAFETEKVINALSDIDSKFGKFAVLGEKDLTISSDVTAILNEGGFEVLHNEYRPIYYQNATISLFGLESNGDISGLLNESNKDSYKLAVVHEPDYFTTTAKSDIALQLSGHTMGGYIQLPIINGLFTKTNGSTYVNGRHSINDSELIISNGLGMEEGYQYRLFCPNQINIITLKK